MVAELMPWITEGACDHDPLETADPAQWHDWVRSVDRVAAAASRNRGSGKAPLKVRSKFRPGPSLTAKTARLTVSVCGYNGSMNVATSRSEVGIRELKNGLSKYIDRVRAGEEVIVTDRGHPVAKLSPLDASNDRLVDLVAAGVVRPPSSPKRHQSRSRIKSKGTVSDLVDEQRR